MHGTGMEGTKGLHVPGSHKSTLPPLAALLGCSIVGNGEQR